MPDMDAPAFYGAAMEKQDEDFFLLTGILNFFPQKRIFIVTIRKI